MPSNSTPMRHILNIESHICSMCVIEWQSTSIDCSTSSKVCHGEVWGSSYEPQQWKSTVSKILSIWSHMFACRVSFYPNLRLKTAVQAPRCVMKDWGFFYESRNCVFGSPLYERIYLCRVIRLLFLSFNPNIRFRLYYQFSVLSWIQLKYWGTSCEPHNYMCKSPLALLVSVYVYYSKIS